MSDTGMNVWRDVFKAWNKPTPPSDEAAAAVITAAMAQDKAEIEAWQVAAETWRDNFQDASCEIERLREALDRIAYETRRKQLPLTALINAIALDAREALNVTDA